MKLISIIHHPEKENLRYKLEQLEDNEFRIADSNEDLYLVKNPQITFFKVVSGKLFPSIDIMNTSKNSNEKFKQLNYQTSRLPVWTKF